MTDLAAWLLEQIAEDEAAARAASPAPWTANAEQDEVLSERGPDEDGMADEDLVVAEGFALSNRQLRANVVHIARWDPARVLAECAAKRRLVEEIAPTVQRFDEQITGEWGGSDEGTAELMLQILAQPYADRPGFDPWWRLKHTG